MAITPLGINLSIIAALDDEPNDVGGLTSAQLKAKFDEGGNAIKDYINTTLIPDTEQEINAVVGGVVLGQIPDGTITPAKLSGEVYSNDDILTADTKTLYGFDGGAVPDDVFSVIDARAKNSLLRELNIMLNLSLGTSNIDAWADLLSDNTRINTAASSGYTLSGGKLASSNAQNSSINTSCSLNGSTSNQKIAQTFKAIFNSNLAGITVQLLKHNAPIGNIYLELWSTSAGVPNAMLASSNNINCESMPDGWGYYMFSFADYPLTMNTTYALVVNVTYAMSGTHFFELAMNTTNPYADGSKFEFNGSSWSNNASYDLYFIVATSECTVIWKPVTATEAPTYAAVCADKTPGVGTITFSVSDDGINWTEITALDKAQKVNFDAAGIYLKCVITGNAEVRAVAWGGY